MCCQSQVGTTPIRVEPGQVSGSQKKSSESKNKVILAELVGVGVHSKDTLTTYITFYKKWEDFWGMGKILWKTSITKIYFAPTTSMLWKWI